MGAFTGEARRGEEWGFAPQQLARKHKVGDSIQPPG